MWVKSNKDSLQAISLPEMEGIADFSSKNTAQVSEHDAQILTNNVDHITEK